MNSATTKTVTPRIVSSAAHARSAKFLRAGSAIRVSRPGRRAAIVSLAGCKNCLSLDRHLLQSAFHLVHHGLGQRRVVEGGCGLLAVVHGPPEELQQRLALRGIRLVLVDEDTGKGRDGVGVLADRI